MRLLHHRRLDVSWLASASGVSEAELHSVVSGAAPSAVQLDDLAHALEFRPADLRVIAKAPALEVLAARDVATQSSVTSLVEIAMALPLEQRVRIHQLVGGLPRDPGNVPDKPPPAYSEQQAGFGATLVAMLCGNRNLNSIAAATRILALLTHGHVFLSAATVKGISRDRVQLTPGLVVGFAATLGMSAGDLAAIVGLEIPEPSDPEDPLVAEMAGLLWNCRHLTAAQVDQVHAEAQSMLVAVPDDAGRDDWNRVYRHHGQWWGAAKGRS